MRSRLTIVSALILVALLCAAVFGRNFKAENSNTAAKYGRAVESVVPATPEAVSDLPPVGSRSRNGLDEIIISENFDALEGGTLPAGWTQVDVDGGYCTQFARNSTWQVYNYGSQYAHSGTNIAMNHYNDAAAPNNDWMILPQQFLGGTITLTYWSASQDPLYLEDYEVRVSTTGDQPANFTNLIQDFNQISTTWTQRTHDLSAYAGSPFWIAFHYNSVDEFVLKIDDLVLEGTQLGSFGTVTGLVIDDNTLSPIQGVTVQLGAGPTTTTDAGGIFWFNSVPADTYDVAFTHPMYESETVLDVTVAENETTDVDVDLHHLNIEIHDFPSSASPVPINDQDTSYMNLDVTGDFVMIDLDVTINITHTYDSDLTIWLETPWNQRVQLAFEVGGAGDNFVNTRFDDEATTPIGSGAAPFTGSFQPQEPLNAADGSSTIGQWTLVVYDGYGEDQGTINNFTLHATSEVLAVDDPNASLPSAYAFQGNYPNPFNATTQFRFDMSRAGHASLVLYNIVGEQVATLVDGNLDAGSHSISFNAADLPSGLYFARFAAGSFAETHKVVLLK